MKFALAPEDIVDGRRRLRVEAKVGTGSAIDTT
jgi:hypothetical protein